MGATKNKAKPPSSPALWLVLAIAGTGLLGCSPHTGQPTHVRPGSPENEAHLTLKDRASLPHRWFVNSVAFSADGKRLATGAGERGKPGEVTVWDMVTLKKLATLNGHTDEVMAVDITRDGKTVASASWDETARLW